MGIASIVRSVFDERVGSHLPNWDSLWHERFTWLDRVSASSWSRLAKFNLTTGLFSIVGNVVLMRVLVGGAQLN